MQSFNLAVPVQAIHYVRNSNDKSVVGLLTAAGSSSANSAPGYMQFSDQGLIRAVRDRQWVVLLGSKILVMDDAEFVATFQVQTSTEITLQPDTSLHAIDDVKGIENQVEEWLSSREVDGRSNVAVNHTRDRLEIRVVLNR